MVFFNPALYKAASDSICASFSAGDASPVLVTVLPGWAKPLCFRVGYAQWGITLTNGNLTIEVHG